MEVNDKKVNRTRKIINYAIAIILAGFLIGLSNIVIDDLDNTVSYPAYSSYQDQDLVKELDRERKIIREEEKRLELSFENIYKMVRVAEDKQEAEQKSFDNWRAARETLGSPDQDPEVMRRLKQQDAYQQVVLDWKMQSDSVSDLMTAERNKVYALDTKEREMNTVATELHQSALQSYSLKVFLIRLLFVAPILILGIFLFLRYRKHTLSPIFMGFSLFSVYAFFVGLVPYLPSYGGYVRYTVGILLTIGLGYYAIKKFNAYTDRKKAELKASTAERASNLNKELAEKAYNNSVCPSCGKNYLLRNWEQLSNVELRVMRPVASNYCRYCGMQIIKKCDACQQNNYAHLPFCINCGEGLK